MQNLFSLLVIAILVGGCAAAYVPAPLPVTHPANPTAPEAPLPPPFQTLGGESVSLPSAGDADKTGQQGTHGGH